MSTYSDLRQEIEVVRKNLIDKQTKMRDDLERFLRMEVTEAGISRSFTTFAVETMKSTVALCDIVSKLIERLEEAEKLR